MCNILAIEHLNFDNSTWTFQLNDISCQLTNGSFPTEAFQNFLHANNKDMENPYILFGTGVINEDINKHLLHDQYCILLKQEKNKKQAFLVNKDDFQMEFIPHPVTFTLC